MANDLEKSLNELKDKYLRSLPDKVCEISSLWSNLCVNPNPEDHEKIHRLAHSLAGSGATFGEDKISKSAKILELALKELKDVLGAISDTKKSIIENHIAELEVCVANVAVDKESNDLEELVEVKKRIFNLKENKIAKMKIMVADDDDLSRAQVCKLLESDGHEIIEATNGQQAIELYDKHLPELILMDVIMPNVTGYQAAEAIKQKSKNRFVPIIFLTAITDNESLAQCIVSGGDDFLNKPIHPLILNAKLKAMQRIRDMYEKVDAYQRNTEEELETSKKVFKSLIQTHGEDIEGLHFWAKSPGHFSGDTRLFRKMDNGHIYILLCDFTGHGLPAALGTIFVADIFRSMTDKAISAEQILLETNKKMLQIMPLGRYCASLLIDYDTKNQHLKIWNNGLPTGLVIDDDHQIIEEIKSQGLPLGIVSENAISDPHELSAKNVNTLIVFSDGVTEAENPEGEMYSEVRLLKKISKVQCTQNVFEALKTDIETFMDGREPVDDISLIVLNFNQ